jgi:hypothetical protein
MDHAQSQPGKAEINFFRQFRAVYSAVAAEVAQTSEDNSCVIWALFTIPWADDPSCRIHVTARSVGEVGSKFGVNSH